MACSAHDVGRALSSPRVGRVQGLHTPPPQPSGQASRSNVPRGTPRRDEGPVHGVPGPTGTPSPNCPSSDRDPGAGAHDGRRCARPTRDPRWGTRREHTSGRGGSDPAGAGHRPVRRARSRRSACGPAGMRTTPRRSGAAPALPLPHPDGSDGSGPPPASSDDGVPAVVLPRPSTILPTGWTEVDRPSGPPSGTGTVTSAAVRERAGQVQGTAEDHPRAGWATRRNRRPGDEVPTARIRCRGDRTPTRRRRPGCRGRPGRTLPVSVLRCRTRCRADRPGSGARSRRGNHR